MTGVRFPSLFVIIVSIKKGKEEGVEKNFQQGVRDALPTALGYISIGLACGVVASPYLLLWRWP